MKRLTAVLLALAMLLNLTACSLPFLDKIKPAPKEDPDSGLQQESPTAPDVSSVEPDIPSGTPDTLPPDPDKGGGELSDPPANSDEYVIRISHSDVTLFYAGETFRLSVWDSEGKDPGVCTFTSDHPEIASVDETGGQVTAVSPGIANITVHAEFASEAKDLKCIVRCRWEEEAGSGGEGITASHTDITLFHAGETFTLSALGVSGIYASSFASADPGVAAVDWMTGVVTAVAPGTTTVTMHVECEAGQFDFPCTVRCQWTEESGTVPGTATAPSLSGFFSTLQSGYEGLGMMMAIEGDLLENYYPGLSGIAAVEEILIREPMISVSNVAVGLVKLSDSASSEDVAAVKSILQARITAQAGGGAWYPESCAAWEKGVITSVSNVVGMFVHPSDAQAMADLFTSSYSN